MATLHVPRPNTLTAQLRSAGFGVFRVTHHVYKETRECVDRAGQPAFEHIFVCDETGEERRWGIERRHDFSVETN